MSKPRVRSFGLTRTVGFGFVGQFDGGELGMVLPEDLCDVGEPNMPSQDDLRYLRTCYANQPVRSKSNLVLCEITCRAVLDKRGRRITRSVDRWLKGQKP